LTIKMAAQWKKTPNEDELDAELRDLEREMVKLRSAKKEALERARPFNEKLEAIARRERECADNMNRLRAEKHDRETQRWAVQRFVEMEAEIKQLKRENETLKLETEMNCKLRRSLEQTTKHSKSQMHKINELNEKLSAEQELRLANFKAVSENTSGSTVGEIQKRLSQTTKLLSRTTEELNETRQRLSDVQERLTVAEQVTAATQQRELQESDNSEQLQLELTPQHQSTTCTGTFLILERLLELESILLCPDRVA